MIASLKANDAFMRIPAQATSLRQYAQSLEDMEQNNELNLGFLTSVQNTLELWKRDWEVLVKADDVIDHKMIESFRQKLGSLREDPVFMTDKSRADRLGYYEKILDRVEAEQDSIEVSDLEELRQVEVTLDMWVVNWAVQTAKDTIETTDTAKDAVPQNKQEDMEPPVTEQISQIIAGYKAILVRLKDEFYCHKMVADLEKVLDSRKWTTQVDLVELKHFEE